MNNNMKKLPNRNGGQHSYFSLAIMRLRWIILRRVEGVIFECFLYELFTLFGDLVTFVFLEFISHYLFLTSCSSGRKFLSNASIIPG